MASRLILLDEPTAGINPTLIRRLVDVIHRLCEQGIQIFLIEHNMPLVAKLCQHVFVMDSGELIYSGTPRTGPGRTAGHRSVSGAGKPCRSRWTG